jgi:hypothetical protein
MTRVHCHRCGRPLAEGTLKYQVAVRVRSMFDGLITDPPESESQDLAGVLAEASRYSEEELNRQVYEDDVFIMCPSCKEAFLEDIYSHIHPKASPEHGRAHLIH